MAQNEDVLGREAQARKLFIVEISEPRPYALLARIVFSSNKPRLDLAFSALAGRAAMPWRENGMVIDSLLISLQRRPTSARGLAHQPDASSRLDPS